jgi:hypothetical protein
MSGLKNRQEETMPLPRAIVAQFHKTAGGRFELWSLTTITEEVAKDGSGGIWLSRDIYDVDWSRAYGYLYHQSGAGGSGPVPVDSIYFAKGDVQIEERPCTLLERSKATGRWRAREIRARNKTRRLRKLPKAFRMESGDLLDWLEVNGIEGSSVWCFECLDVFPENDLCEHCWWCDKTGWWSTPSKRCKCKDREECYV